MTARITRLFDSVHPSAANELVQLFSRELQHVPIQQFGLPPAEHWKRSVAGVVLSPDQQIAVHKLNQRLSMQRQEARYKASQLPALVQSYLSEPMEDMYHQLRLQYTMQGEQIMSQLQGCILEDHNAMAEF